MEEILFTKTAESSIRVLLSTVPHIVLYVLRVYLDYSWFLDFKL